MAVKPEITFIENILKQNELLLNNEYDLLGISINNEEIIQKKRISEYENKQLMGHFQGNMKQFAYQLEKKKELKQVETEYLNNSEVDIINDSNVFNIVKEKKEYIDWKQLDNTIKKDKVKEYLELNSQYYYLNDELFEELYELIDSKKINYKKYIEYDKVNERIVKMPVLFNDKDSEKTIINISDTKKIKKSNKFFK
jgi:hypothetical protein